MFVFKTAVVGAGTMGGEIAQTLAAADLPVVLKDIDQKFVDQGLEKARQVTEGQLQGLVKKEKLTEEQAKAQLEHTVGPDHRRDRLRRVRRRRLRRRGGARADRDQAAGVRRAGRRHAGPRDPGQQHLVALDHRDGRRDAAPRQGGRLPLLLSRLDDAADRGRGGRGDVRRDGADDDQLRAADPQDADSLRRGARVRGEPGPQLGRERDLALQGRVRHVRAGHRQGDRRGARDADGPVLPQRPARAGHGAARRRAPAQVVRRPLLRLARDAGAGGGRQLRAEDGQGLLRARTGGTDGRRNRTADRRDRRALHAQGVRRGMSRARGGRVHPARDRDRDDDRRGDPAGAVRARRRARAGRDAGRARARRGRVGRSLRPAADPAAAGGAGEARQEDRPGLLPVSAAGRRPRPEGDRAARDARPGRRSSGSTARPPIRSARR